MCQDSTLSGLVPVQGFRVAWNVVNKLCLQDNVADSSQPRSQVLPHNALSRNAPNAPQHIMKVMLNKSPHMRISLSHILSMKTQLHNRFSAYFQSTTALNRPSRKKGIRESCNSITETTKTGGAVTPGLSPDAPELRWYQKECINSCMRKLKGGVRRQVVSLPVGSGKTVLSRIWDNVLSEECSCSRTDDFHSYDSRSASTVSWGNEDFSAGTSRRTTETSTSSFSKMLSQ